QDLTTQVSWTSSDEAVAQVSDVSGSQGLVTGLNAGETTIGATLNGIEGSTTVIVSAATLTSVVITPPNPSIASGTALQLIATGPFRDGTVEDLSRQVSWTSGNGAIAQVSNLPDVPPGRVTGLGVGSTSITATLSGVSGSTTVTVTAATLTSIVIAPPDPSIAKGTEEQLTATDTFSDGGNADRADQPRW